MARVAGHRGRTRSIPVIPAAPAGAAPAGQTPRTPSRRSSASNDVLVVRIAEAIGWKRAKRCAC